MSNKDCKLYNFLILSLCILEIGIILYCLQPQWLIGAGVLLLGLTLFLIWILKDRFEEYYQNPFKDPNFFFHKRDIRIKISLFAFIIGIAFVQFYLLSLLPFSNRKAMVSDRHIIGDLIIVVTSIIILKNAILANKKHYHPTGFQKI